MQGGGPLAQGDVRSDRVVVLPPPFDEHLGLEQRVKRSVTPIFLTASATVLPLPTSTSTLAAWG